MIHANPRPELQSAALHREMRIEICAALLQCNTKIPYSDLLQFN